jgi:hypothetical protein
MHLYAGGSLKVTDAAAIGHAFWSNGRKTAVRESGGHNKAPADKRKSDGANGAATASG